MLLDRILVTEKTMRTPRIHLVHRAMLKHTDGMSNDVIMENRLLIKINLCKWLL